MPWQSGFYGGQSGNATQLQSYPIASTAPTNGYALIWNGTNWSPTVLSGGGNMNTSTYDPAGIDQQVVGTTATQTLTNKRITQRVLALSANSATPSVDTDNYDVVHITSQTTSITGFTMSGTPNDGDTLRISITGTASVPITWGSSFESSGTITLPTTTSSTTRLDVGFFWNTETSKWRCMGVS